MNDKKLEILNRLVKEGHIDLREALVLLEGDDSVTITLPRASTLDHEEERKKYPNWPNTDIMYLNATKKPYLDLEKDLPPNIKFDWNLALLND